MILRLLLVLLVKLFKLFMACTSGEELVNSVEAAHTFLIPRIEVTDEFEIIIPKPELTITPVTKHGLTKVKEFSSCKAAELLRLLVLLLPLSLTMTILLSI